MVFASPGRQPSTSMPKTCCVFGPASIWNRGSPVLSVDMSSNRRPSMGALAAPGASRIVIDGAPAGPMEASGASAATRSTATIGTTRRIRRLPSPSERAPGLRHDVRRAVDRVEVVALVPGRVAAIEEVAPRRRALRERRILGKALLEGGAERRILRQHLRRHVLGDVGLHVFLALEGGG